MRGKCRHCKQYRRLYWCSYCGYGHCYSCETGHRCNEFILDMVRSIGGALNKRVEKESDLYENKVFFT